MATFKPISDVGLSGLTVSTKRASFKEEIERIECSKTSPLHRAIELPLDRVEFLTQEVLYLFSSNEAFGAKGQLQHLISDGTELNWIRSPLNSARVLLEKRELFTADEYEEYTQLLSYYEHLGLEGRIDGVLITEDSEFGIDFALNLHMKNAFAFKNRLDSLLLGREDSGVLVTTANERMVSTHLHSPGHSMMLHVVEDQTGRYRILFENTGFGAEARGEKEAIVLQEIGPLSRDDILKVKWMLIILRVETPDEVMEEITKSLGAIAIAKETSLRQMGGSCVAVYRRNEVRLVSHEVQLKAHQAILDDLIERLKAIDPMHPMLDFAQSMRAELPDELLKLRAYSDGARSFSGCSSVSVTSPRDFEVRINIGTFSSPPPLSEGSSPGVTSWVRDALTSAKGLFFG